MECTDGRAGYSSRNQTLNLIKISKREKKIVFICAHVFLRHLTKTLACGSAKQTSFPNYLRKLQASEVKSLDNQATHQTFLTSKNSKHILRNKGPLLIKIVISNKIVLCESESVGILLRDRQT